MSVHIIMLEQEDVAVAPHPGVPFAVAIQLTLHGITRLDEARMKHGEIAVHVAVQFPSDEFYPERLPEPPE